MGSVSDQLPQIDLSGLRPSLPTGERWEAVRTAVEAALVSHGCFDAIYPSLFPDLRHSLFEQAVPDLFALPLESKLRNTSDEPYQGYIGRIPSMPYESLRIDAAASPAAVEGFTRLMWPQGNPTFRDAVVGFAAPLQDLVGMVQRMILESLGMVEKQCYDAFVGSVSYGLRLSEYGVPSDQETEVGMGSHVDPNFVTVVCQHRVGGLEIETWEGDWVDAVPSPDSVTVMIGQAFQAWTNGKFRAPVHRVKMVEKKKRFSALYGSRPSFNATVKTPEELVDKQRSPLLYRPYNYSDYIKFRFTEEGRKLKDPFIAYCGLGKEGTA